MTDTGCEACKGMGLQLDKYRVIRMHGDRTSRVMWLCSFCRGPLDRVLAKPRRYDPTNETCFNNI